MAKISKLMISLLLLLAICVISRPAEATSIYVFDPNQSAVVQTGGFAGVHETYPVEGYFQLFVDIDAGFASFVKVDANMLEPSGFLFTEDFGVLFNMTGLTSTVIDETTIEFEGKTADGTESDVRLKLNLNNGSAHLTGNTTPPPESADMFFYDVNAVATRKYAGGTGEPNEPYLIGTAGQLNAIGAEPDDWDKHFKLMADIDLQGYSQEQFNIIGTMREKFVGSFDGAGYTISNFRYSAGNRNFVGLFSQVGDGAQIKNVMLDYVQIEVEKGASIGTLVGFNLRGIISGCCVSGNVIGGDSSGNLGALVGFNSRGTVSNCSASGSVTGESNVASIGGLVGNNAYGDIYNCLATTTVSGGSGSGDTGGLVGYSEAGTISNSFAAGNISGDTSLGGLVGYKNDGSIIQCYAIGAVSGNTRLGGLVGRNDSGIISDCYATGSVDGDDALGGLVGRNHKGSVSYCYAAGMVNGNSRLGGFVGNEDRGSYISSFWDADANPGLAGAGDIDPDPNDIFSKTTAEMQTASTFLEAGWDFVDETENGSEDVWKIEGLSYPRFYWQKYSGGSGTPNNPYQIATAEDLINLGETPEDYDKHFILTNDIVLNPNLQFDRAIIAPDISYAEDWFQGVPFTGVFDGNDHTIANLTIVGDTYLGLFGQLESVAEIRNLGLNNPSIDAGDGRMVGTLVGSLKNGTVINCYAKSCTVVGRIYVGGLVGSSVGGSITNCFVNDCNTLGKVTVGGLVGEMRSGTIKNCYSTGYVSGDQYMTGSMGGTGGLVGQNRGGVITACYSKATVDGNGNVGGLVGDLDLHGGTVENCYARGDVSSISPVGGLVGLYSGNTRKIKHCYSTGRVDGPSIAYNVPGYGGLIGGERSSPFYSSPYTDDCFWDVNESGLEISNGGFGLTTAKMQMASTYINAWEGGVGWDFVDETTNGTEDIWWIFEGRDYPRLSWERVLVDDFEDGEALPLWQNYEPDSEKIRLEEINGRLEVLANDTADDIVAGYISSGWRLDVTNDFALRADFHFGKIAAGDSWVMLLLLPSLDEPVGRFTVLEAGCLENQPFYLHEIDENGSIIQGTSVSRSTDDGTLYISYDAEQDELYMSYSGYGKAKAWQTVEGLLQNQWAARPVYVVIGGGSDRVVLDAGDAYLDNFAVDSGVLDFTAEFNDDGTEEP